jgi:glycosyltransferase involved in cell wall biosynthesis
VLDERPHARFFLAGEGPLRGDLEAQARPSASPTGSCSSASSATSPALLSAFDLSVFPSLWEGTPLTAFEALAAGKAIVATDADGLLDVLTDGKDALVVPKRERGRVGRRLVGLVDDPAERARLSANARTTGERYDIARSCERWSGSTRSSTRCRGHAPQGRAARRPVVPFWTTGVRG